MKKYVIGDIHGELDKLINCIKSINLTREDKLIFLGDYVDRGPDSYGVIEYLINLSKNHECIFIRGNHDDSWMNGIINDNFPLWKQGAQQTMLSYNKVEINPEIHLDFFNNLLSYYIDEDNNLYVHGGFNRHVYIEHQEPEDIYWWDRDLVHLARSWSMMNPEAQKYKFKIKGSGEYGKFKEIFVGHTPVQMLTKNNKPLLTTPQNYANIWVCDTGAGKYEDGLVTIMNVETKEYKQF